YFFLYKFDQSWEKIFSEDTVVGTLSVVASQFPWAKMFKESTLIKIIQFLMEKLERHQCDDYNVMLDMMKRTVADFCKDGKEEFNEKIWIVFLLTDHIPAISYKSYFIQVLSTKISTYGASSITFVTINTGVDTGNFPVIA
ncbi:hypothetical protein ACJX0J_022704, partial [Zea mays]